MNAQTDNPAMRFYQDLLQALRKPSGTAYRHYEERADYPQLMAEVARTWKLLSGRRGDNILQYGEKSLASFGAVFGILLSGNAWVPLSADLPGNRQRAIIQMAEAGVLLSDVPLPDELAADVAAAGIQVLRIDQAPQADPAEVSAAAVNEDDVAYIMFTSGSTGVPKGVPMTHGNYINFVYNCMNILPFQEGDVFSDFHDWAFDISIFYLFCCPLAGGAFAPVRRKEDKVVALRFMQENAVTVWSSVPSCISRIQQLYPEDSPITDIRILFLCGEPFSLKVLYYCQKALEVPNIYNFYGLTETGVENFHHRCLPGDTERYESFGFVPIGLPLPGNQVRISEDKELLLAGCQLTPGYLGGVGQDRFETVAGVRWYRTGDVVVQAEGVYFCKGRTDSQVKVSGYRIELMDIEVNMKRFPGVREAVCVTRQAGDALLIVGIVQPEKDDVDLDALRNHLAAQLPAYMLPKRFFVSRELPLNQNGKIDRRRIRELHT